MLLLEDTVPLEARAQTTTLVSRPVELSGVALGPAVAGSKQQPEHSARKSSQRSCHARISASGAGDEAAKLEKVS